MTNKLPKIGDKYISKYSGNIVKVTDLRTDITIITDGEDIWTPHYFNDCFKRLESKESETKPAVDNKITDWSFIYNSGLTPEQIHIFELLIEKQGELEERIKKLERKND